jgi:hypothetical protein
MGHEEPGTFGSASDILIRECFGALKSKLIGGRMQCGTVASAPPEFAGLGCQQNC